MSETERITKVRIVGPYFGSSGYAAHVRGLARGMAENGADVRISTQKPVDWERVSDDQELRWLKTEPESDETVIQVSTPPSWSMGLADCPKHFIGFLVWEGSNIPVSWLEYLTDPRVDQIWVPSQHVFNAVIATATVAAEENGKDNKIIVNIPSWTKKLCIVQHGFDPAVYHPVPKQPNRPFTFLVSKGWVHPTEDRGGVQYVVKAFNEEFTLEDDVRLVVKLNPAYIGGVDPNTFVQGMLAANGITEAKARMEFTLSEVPESDLAKLYGKGDVFVCATRCEGFNLPGLEAHACGLPTMQTGYGGQLDYMTKDSDWFVEHALCDVTHDVMYEECMWATPRLDDLRKKMRYAFNSKEIVRRKGAAALRESAAWTWFETGRKAMENIYSLD